MEIALVYNILGNLPNITPGKSKSEIWFGLYPSFYLEKYQVLTQFYLVITHFCTKPAKKQAKGMCKTKPS